jgi:hypothetical protein
MSKCDLLLLIAISLTLTTPASADCYDVFGCSDTTYFRAADLRDGPNCEFLWQMRNSIYSQRGYCFHTQRGIQAFGNAGCKFADIDRVPLNQFERANASTVQSVETSMHCSAD